MCPCGTVPQAHLLALLTCTQQSISCRTCCGGRCRIWRARYSCVQCSCACIASDWWCYHATLSACQRTITVERARGPLRTDMTRHAHRCCYGRGQKDSLRNSRSKCCKVHLIINTCSHLLLWHRVGIVCEATQGYRNEAYTMPGDDQGCTLHTHSLTHTHKHKHTRTHTHTHNWG